MFSKLHIAAIRSGSQSALNHTITVISKFLCTRFEVKLTSGDLPSKTDGLTENVRFSIMMRCVAAFVSIFLETSPPELFLSYFEYIRYELAPEGSTRMTATIVKFCIPATTYGLIDYKEVGM